MNSELFATQFCVYVCVWVCVVPSAVYHATNGIFILQLIEKLVRIHFIIDGIESIPCEFTSHYAFSNSFSAAIHLLVLLHCSFFRFFLLSRTLFPPLSHTHTNIPDFSNIENFALNSCNSLVAIIIYAKHFTSLFRHGNMAA